jgi:hypothetical protein
VRLAIAAVAVLVLAIAASGCGQASAPALQPAKTPLAVAAPGRLCPPSDAKPRSILSRSAGDVLVPGHPISALICRYWGRSGQLPEPEDLHARILHGEHGHAERSLAEARRVVSQQVTRHLAGELDALRPISRNANCDEVLGGRSELIVFHYHGVGEARVLIVLEACVPVGNGRIVRAGLELGGDDGNGETHWLDEAMV